MPAVNVLIGSGGRRNYLVRWFREAMQKLDIDGTVCVIDASPCAPALVDADRAQVVPSLTDPAYEATLDGVCAELQISLAFSLNDYELATWEGPVGKVFERHGIQTVTVPSSAQRIVEDKLLYPSAFAEAGIATPEVVNGTDVIERGLLPEDRGAGFIVKHRYGSGSGGLTVSSSSRVRDDLRHLAAFACDRRGTRVQSPDEGLDALVVQTRVDGDEYGLDVVDDLGARFQAALARRKLRMRSGETDQATVVDAEPFSSTAQRIASTLGHRGLIDTDLIVEGDVQWLIDVNPRFGGGYPFSHLGGADIPACYLAWHLGIPLEETWLRPRPGVTSAKAESMHMVSDLDTGAADV